MSIPVKKNIQGIQSTQSIQSTNTTNNWRKMTEELIKKMLIDTAPVELDDAKTFYWDCIEGVGLVDLNDTADSGEKIRKRCNNNAFELVCAVLLLNESVNNYTELKTKLEDPRLVCSEQDLKEYKKDLELQDKKKLKSYISVFNESARIVSIPDIDSVYLTGQSTSSYPEILKLNKGIDKKILKADIYIKTIDGSFIGLSVKQMKNATKSNYSVHAMFTPQDSAKLNIIKNQVLESFPKFKKEDRKEVNEIFKDSNNNYWEYLRIMIKRYNDHIVSVLFDCITCYKLKYPIYEFNGDSMNRINRDGMVFNKDLIRLYEHPPFYLDSKGKPRSAAKLFYMFEDNINNKKYRVEIRWKGNIHNSSPQFQLFELFEL